MTSATEYYSRTVLLFYFTRVIRAKFYTYIILYRSLNVQSVCVCVLVMYLHWQQCAFLRIYVEKIRFTDKITISVVPYKSNVMREEK